MNINIEPLQTTPLPPAANNQPRRVEPAYQTQYALTRDDPRDTIRFSDQLIRSNLGEPDTTLPRQSPLAQTAPQPDAPQPIPLKPTPHKPSQDTPKLGDVSPVEQKQTTLQYHKTLRLERTLNLGSIVDLIV